MSVDMGWVSSDGLSCCQSNLGCVESGGGGASGGRGPGGGHPGGRGPGGAGLGGALSTHSETKIKLEKNLQATSENIS